MINEQRKELIQGHDDNDFVMKIYYLNCLLKFTYQF